MSRHLYISMTLESAINEGIIVTVKTGSGWTDMGQ